MSLLEWQSTPNAYLIMTLNSFIVPKVVPLYLVWKGPLKVWYFRNKLYTKTAHLAELRGLMIVCIQPEGKILSN